MRSARRMQKASSLTAATRCWSNNLREGVHGSSCTRIRSMADAIRLRLTYPRREDVRLARLGPGYLQPRSRMGRFLHHQRHSSGCWYLHGYDRLEPPVVSLMFPALALVNTVLFHIGPTLLQRR